MRTLPIIAIIIGLGLPACARAGDWPTFMHDNQRGGVTADGLTLPLAQHWVWRSTGEPTPAWPPPQPGWTELPKVQFDDAFYTVADRERVYFGSSVDNQVYALDAKTGAICWRFFASGPVRLAPTLAGGILYFGADDGKVYAVRADDGKPVWTFDAALSARQVLGNGRPISLWPVRTSILVEGNRVYCGAGIFPYHRDFMLALEAATGKLVWKNDAVSATGGFSPQGYLLASKDGLIVPSGRAPPVVLERDSGKVAFNLAAAVGKGEIGGTYGVLVGDTFYLGTQNTLHGFKAEDGKYAGRWLNAEQLLATADSYLVLKGSPPPAYGRKPTTGKADDVTAYDRRAYDKLARKDAAAIEGTKRWRHARPNLEAVIAAGPHVIAGGDNEVVILDAGSGKELWTGKVEGKAVGLAVAHGRLLVSTTRGTVHCFATGAAPEPPAEAKGPDWPAEPAVKELVVTRRGIRFETNHLSKGYVVIMGTGAVRLGCLLAEGNELRITCLVKDAQEVGADRLRVAHEGLYGRVTVELADTEALPYPDYAADLIVQLDEKAQVKDSRRILKPYGGILLTRGQEAAAFRELGLESSLLLEPNRRWGKLIRSDLKGAGAWTHQYGDAAGSGSSGDQRIKGKLDVLWFGAPGADEFPDRHERAMSPLLNNGRVIAPGWNFLTGQANLICFDAYNGVRYWKRDLKGAVRLNVPVVSGNLACDENSVFVVDGPQCHQLDARTGETKKVFQTPAAEDGTRPDWGYLAVANGRLVGSAALREGFSNKVFAFHIDSGQLSWRNDYKEIRDTTIALSNGKLLFLEKGAAKAKPSDSPPKVDRKGQPIEPDPTTHTAVAQLAATGKQLWTKEIDLSDCGRWDKGTWGLLHGLATDDVYVLAGAYTIYGRRTDLTPRKALALSTKDGSLLWNEVVENKSRPVIMQDALLAEPLFYDLHKGSKILKPQGQKMQPWTMGPRSGGCGPLSASACMVFGRGGYTVWRNVVEGPSGTFVGTRPGCAINIIPAGGVVVQTEASSGCSCYQAVQCTIVFRPPLD